MIASARSRPAAPAVRCGDEQLTYAELDALSNRVARALADLGVGPGDRVALWLNKSVAAVAATQAVLRLGAAYVPVDPFSPAARAAAILADCRVGALVADAARASSVRAGALAGLPVLLTDGRDAGAGRAGGPLRSWDALGAYPDTPPAWVPVGDDDLAYVLYTSGTTGTPRGVCLSHRNALAFVAWAAATVGAGPADRFSCHAPLHFDLSVFDLYAAFLAGACACLVPEDVAHLPAALTAFARRERITVWYSVPSVLAMMLDRGGLEAAGDLALRVVAFAGEPFGVAHLRRLAGHLPGARLFNWYGPTETNVCTSYEVTSVPDGRAAAVPIGRAASGDRVWALRDDGAVAGPGEDGELVCSGPTVFLGYWGEAPHGGVPYRTGDRVRLLDDGNYVFLGRRDHMVKVRGHRIELGEVEHALLCHDAVAEAAVVVAGAGSGARLVAFVAPAGEAHPSARELRRHCALHLPRALVAHDVHVVTALPRTSTGKVDRARLAELA